MTTLIIPDAHAAPGEDMSRFEVLGKFMVDLKPDTVINLGDGADMPSLCVAPDTFVLKDDFTWEFAGNLKIGDSILGFEKRKQPGGSRNGWYYKRGKVTQNKRFTSAKGWKITTDKGTITVSNDHKFLSFVGETKGDRRFRSADKLRVGSYIQWFSNVWLQNETKLSDIGYIAGFLDGEGSYAGGRLSWSQNPGPVADKVLRIFTEFGFNVGVYSEENREVKHWYIKGSYHESWRALGIFRPERLLSKAIEDSDGKFVCSFSKEDAKVLSKEPIENVEVIGLETSVETYISNGLLSHNCSYDKGTRGFEGRRYLDDCEAFKDSQERLWEPLRRQKKRMPYRVYLEGNHEYRIKRAQSSQAELTGVMDMMRDLELGRWYDDVVEYEGNTPGVKEIDGIMYAHYFVSGVMARAIGGEHPAYMLLSKGYKSATMGHTHTADICIRTRFDGSRIRALVAGCFVDTKPAFAGNAADLWWSGVFVKRNLDGNGNYDLTEISIEELKKNYG